MWEDRKKQALKEAAIPGQKIATAASSPTPTCHPMLSSWIQSRKLTITIKSILLFQSIKKVLPSSLRGSCNIVVPTVDSSCMHVAPGTAIAASFSSCFFLSSRIPSHPEKTYNLEPPISIYLKNTSMHCPYCHRTLQYTFINIF